VAARRAQVWARCWLDCSLICWLLVFTCYCSVYKVVWEDYELSKRVEIVGSHSYKQRWTEEYNKTNIGLKGYTLYKVKITKFSSMIAISAYYPSVIAPFHLSTSLMICRTLESIIYADKLNVIYHSFLFLNTPSTTQWTDEFHQA
jgi:hypothetical protein